MVFAYSYHTTRHHTTPPSCAPHRMYLTWNAINTRAHRNSTLQPPRHTLRRTHILPQRPDRTMAQGTTSCHTAPHHIIPYCATRYDTIVYHTIPYHTIPYNTIPYHTPHHKPPPLPLLSLPRALSAPGPDPYRTLSRLPFLLLLAGSGSPRIPPKHCVS